MSDELFGGDIGVAGEMVVEAGDVRFWDRVDELLLERRFSVAVEIKEGLLVFVGCFGYSDLGGGWRVGVDWNKAGVNWRDK